MSDMSRILQTSLILLFLAVPGLLRMTLSTVTDTIPHVSNVIMLGTHSIGSVLYGLLRFELGEDGHRLESINVLMFMGEVFFVLQDTHAGAPLTSLF